MSPRDAPWRLGPVFAAAAPATSASETRIAIAANDLRRSMVPPLSRARRGERLCGLLGHLRSCRQMPVEPLLRPLPRVREVLALAHAVALARVNDELCLAPRVDERLVH